MKNTLNLTSEQIKELEELSNYPVDYSDIPETVDFSKAHQKGSDDTQNELYEQLAISEAQFEKGDVLEARKVLSDIKAKYGF